MIMPAEEKYLKNLLEFSHCKATNDIHSHALTIAIELLTNWKLQSFSQIRPILGVEFYLYIPKIHEDSAVHVRDEQLSSGTFYFHTKSKSPNWSPPIFNRHGVDITCGSKDKKIYGGILIRHVGGDNNKDGSGYALRAIMRGDSGFKTISHSDPFYGWTIKEKEYFKKLNNESIFGGDIQLIYNPVNIKQEIIARERVGIKKTSHAESLLGFIAKSEQ